MMTLVFWHITIAMIAYLVLWKDILKSLISIRKVMYFIQYFNITRPATTQLYPSLKSLYSMVLSANICYAT